MKHTGPPRRQITEIVTTANQRFHDALDEVEVEIVSSKFIIQAIVNLLGPQLVWRHKVNSHLACLVEITSRTLG